MVRVKLCGITSESDRDAAVAAGADAIGVIVDVPVETPREVTAERAADIVAGAPPFVTTVLVTMPETVEQARTLHERVGTDAIQVHGNLSPDAVGQLREQVPADVVAAIGVHDDHTAYAASADALLVDSTDDQGGGGTGETHDWDHTSDIVDAVDTPVVLAGGLTPDNVSEAVETVRPFAVDTASGIERTGGVKDHDAMTAFVENATGHGSDAVTREVEH